jgi:DNA processing protein
MYLDDSQHSHILWSMLHEPGDALAQLIFRHRPDPVADYRSGQALKIWTEVVAEAAPEYLLKLSELLERIKLRIDHISVAQAVERGIRWGAKPVFPSQLPGLWEKFSDLELHAPYLLWVAGDEQVLDQTFVGVVGTRQPSERGLRSTARVVFENGLPVVSGGAVGVDAKAHQCAMDLGLPTIAYMAGGLDRAYPQANWDLFHQMVRSGGALVSELAPGASPSRFRFLQRNRLIAAHSNFLVVTEAGYRSGSKNTANHARALGREVFAVSGNWSDKSAQGCNAMIREGLAQPWSFTDQVEPSLNQKRVLDAMREGCTEPAAIARESGMGISEVIRELRNLRLAGQIA